ncbi:sensor histidine kinase [Alteromonas sp. CYL-A6]|uniref:sensor histidine kinase n=1 Tax=Alteromonas nitratireducens TaxID=3390813 RepID=UPI0034C1202A
MIAIGTFTRSSSFRVGVLLTSLATIAVLFILYFWRLASSDIFVREARAAVSAERFAFEQVYASGGIEAVIRAVSNRLSHNDANGVYLLLAPDGAARAGNLSSASLSGISDTAYTRLELPLKAIHREGSGRTLIDVLLTRVPLGEHQLVIGRNIDQIDRAQWFGKTFSWVVIGLLAMAGILSFAVAIYVVNRINRMSRTADSIIKTGSLKERLEIDSNWDDLSRLAVMFNQMLDKIEEAVSNIKSVTDNIAHDLRTPLSRLRSTLEQIDDPQLRHKATSEADNLLNMFNSLLRISDIETRRHREGFCHIQLDTLVQDVVEMYQPLAEDKEVTISASLAPQPFFADPNLLFQAIANVLDNAVKYSATGGHIEIRLLQTGKRVVLAVNDNGEGIAHSDATKLERRFFRAETSRTTQGNGLGLSLVSAIVTLHQGELWFVYDPLNAGHGLGVTMTFPIRVASA